MRQIHVHNFPVRLTAWPRCERVMPSYGKMIATFSAGRSAAEPRGMEASS